MQSMNSCNSESVGTILGVASIEAKGEIRRDRLRSIRPRVPQPIQAVGPKGFVTNEEAQDNLAQKVDESSAPKPTMRHGCVDCHLIEPEPGTWVNGRCPRCLPYAPNEKRNSNPKYTDLTGRTFGRLTALQFERAANGETAWKCRCTCGTVKVIRAEYLTSGDTKSCGCLLRDPEFTKARVASVDPEVRRRNLRIYRRGLLAGKFQPWDREGRAAARGEQIGCAVLTEAAVRAIREAYAKGGVSYAVLAKQYGVKPNAIAKVVQRKNWRHV